ncbi:MAG: hypothetical protein M4579_003809 [Chaenotheca gracillima]|nr:MAG: hypothetical protein M4579_003809 [Chaenotheca gracillima]
MSSVSSWLKGQRKSDLVSYADEAGLKEYESLKKADLETALEEHLRANETTLSKNPKFNPFYSRAASSASPVKRERVSSNAAPTSEGEAKPAKPRGRRVTKVTDEVGTTDDSSPDTAGRKSALLTRTPRPNLALARSVPLPPSPAVVADAIDRRTAVIRSKVSDAWDDSGVTKRAEGIRDALSSVVSIEAATLAIEAIGLRPEILPLRYAFTIPPLALLKTAAWPVALPDFFLILTSSFWAPLTLWITTSLTVPLIFAYFFNLTRQGKSGHAGTRSRSANTGYEFDPLTFNVAKALIAILVYSQDVKFGGLIGNESVERIRGSVPGGIQGILLGAGIGALASIYEAVLKK